jgi:cation-transporting ATPase I
VRGAQRPDHAPLVRNVKSALARLDGVDWAEVDAIVGRAVIVFDPESVQTDELIETIETVENRHGASHERFPLDRPDHPADVEPIERNLFGIAADVVGMGVATGVQVLRVLRIPAEIPGIVAVVDGQPRVRRFFENRFGRPVTDATLVTANALAQALGQGPAGLVVDIAHRVATVSELRARRSVWNRREPDLAREPKDVRGAARSVAPRPAPLPTGPVERYSDRAAIASLGGFAVVLGLTRDPRRATDLLFVGIPKAATMGREAFAALFDRGLASQGVITMDPAALRRLDRIDTLVLDARVVEGDTWSMADVIVFDDRAELTECTVRARSLFDGRGLLAGRQSGAWLLAPLDDAYTLPPGARARGDLAAAGGRRVLGLWRGDQFQAHVAVVHDVAPLARELVRAARAADLEVHLAGGSTAFAKELGIDSRLEPGRLGDELRRLQVAGRVPILISGDDPEAHRAADLGLGVEIAGERPPWSADVLTGPGLANAWRLVDAVPTARAVSRRSARFALGGASAGGAWAFLGPTRSAAQRALLATNAAALLSIAAGGLAGVRAAARSVPRPGPRHPWHELETEETLALLQSSRRGLTVHEQAKRRANSSARVSDQPVSLVRATIDELENPLTPLLALGTALSAAVGSVADAALVGGVGVANALVGATQRVRTERSMTSLEEAGESPVRVRTNGEATDIPADQLVVGDVIELGAGDTVRADCRLVEAAMLEVDESAITGESLPIDKAVARTPGAPVAERTSMLYDGSVVSAGNAVAVVVAVGADTEAGRSAAAAADAPPSGVEQRLSALTRLTLPVTMAAGALVTGLGFLHRRRLAEAASTGVALTVAAVPEGLPMLATMAQIAAARRLASRNVLVRNPRALEALGRADQVCFDKTGTLTQGAISLALVSNGVDEERFDALSEQGRAVLAAAVRATPTDDGPDALPHATDQAISAGAAAVGVANDDGIGEWVPIEEIPFESRRGYHAVRGNAGNGDSVVVIKGAPEVVLPLATTWRRNGDKVPLDADARRRVDDHVRRLGRRGLRVLAIGQARHDGATELGEDGSLEHLELLGFVALADRVRPTAVRAIDTVRAAGARVVMVTGDHPSTAEAVAADLDLLDGGRVITGADMDRLTDQELDQVLGEISAFARVTPLHKVRIVEAYQRAGRSVAMTGDGVNDIAAIRRADAGIALGRRGTSAARAAADVVVVDDRIETIVDAITEGRAMWISVRDAIAILVGGNLGEAGFILAGSAVTGRSPLNPRQLLLVNLLTDMAPALAIALREAPDRADETLLHGGPDASLGGALVRQIAVRAGATAAGATLAWVTARFTGTPTRARTVALAALVGTQLGQTVLAGGRSRIVLGATAVSAAALVGVVQTPGLSQFFGCRPLGPVGWLTAAGASATAAGASIAVPWAYERIRERMSTTAPDARLEQAWSAVG